MSRLIDADALMVTLKIPNTDCEECKSADPNYGICMRDFAEACTAIKNAPTIEGRKRGEWIPKPDIYLDEQTWECSECGEPWIFIEGTPSENRAHFCPNCGADMRGGKND